MTPWSPSPNRILAVASLVLFILAALAERNVLVNADALLLGLVGAACLAGAHVW